jgi:hypothetical protein
MPSNATAIQSRPRGQRLFIMNAIGSRIRKPVPKRNTPSVTGSVAGMTNRVAPPAMPPIALDAIAARTPDWSRVMAMLLGPGE